MKDDIPPPSLPSVQELTVTGDLNTPLVSQIDLDIGQADAVARRQIAPSTQAVYRTAFAQFDEYCSRLDPPETTLPARTKAVYAYLGHLAKRGEQPDASGKKRQNASASWLNIVVSAISWRHLSEGYVDPTVHPAVVAFLKGARRGEAAQRRPKKAHALIGAAEGLTNEVALVIASITGDDLAAFRDRAMLLLGWAAAFRRSELASLTLADLHWRGDTLWIPARRSKGDQEGLAVKEGKGKAIIPTEDASLCPVRSLRAWLNELERATGREAAAQSSRDLLPVFVGLRPGKAIRDASGRQIGRELHLRSLSTRSAVLRRRRSRLTA